MPTNDDLLFAEHAVKGGFVGREEIEASLSVQRRMEEMGVRDSLRNVMVNRGVLREGDAALVAKAAGLAPGRDPIPGFTLEARVGTGAMGSVYKAWQRGMQRYVAIKILRRDLTNDPRQVERLRREATLVGKLDHPNVVRGLDSGETNGLVWFAMEFVDGETLRDRIRREGRIPVDEAVAIARQLAEALVHAAEQGIVHRDIKPGNVLLTKQGVPRLSDYGLAKGQTDDALTAIDATLGTPQYVAPEQARNPRDADIRSDVYSLGATLYTMLSGRPPFEGDSLAQTLTKVLYERPTPLRDLVEDLPDAVGYVVERSMAKDRRHRYPTPAAMLHDLVCLEQGSLRVPAGFSGDIEVFEEKRRSRRLWTAGVTVVTSAVLFGALALWWENESEARRNADEARALLEDARAVPGAEEHWDGHTVAEMIRRLELLRSEYPGAPASDEALVDLARWRKQERELQRVQELNRRAAASDGEWPALIAQFQERIRLLAAEPDALVARKQAAVALAALEERRDRRAEREIDALRGDAAPKALADGAKAWSAAAERVRAQFYGGGPAPAADAASETAVRFETAVRDLDACFAPWRAAAARGGALERGDLAAAAAALASVDAALAADADLTRLLAELPPAGRWAGAAAERREEAASRLREAARRATESLRADVERALGRKAYDEARGRIDAFAATALPEHAGVVADLRSRVDAERDAEVAGSRDATSAASLRFFDAYGRLDFVRSAQVLDELERTLSGRAAADPAASEFLVAARRLLELTERHVWDRFRAGVSAYAAGGGEITDRRTGIRYHGISGVRTSGTNLVFTYGNGQTWQGVLADVALDDVLRAGAVPLDDPESALAAAALRITQHRVQGDPRRGLATLATAQPWLAAAARAPGTSPVVARLVALRDEKVRATQSELDDAEDTARRIHEAALRSLQDGRGDLALEGLRSLRDLPRLRQTDYAVSRRDEIRRDIERAEGARRAGSFAARFPGATLVEAADGTAELHWDFESSALDRPEGRSALSVVDGRVEIGSRLSVVADRPAPVAAGDGGSPVHLGHVLTWLAADDQGAPRDAPLQIDCPFVPRKRIEVAFTCRSERPFFVAVSVCGATAGILSASESLQGGRGVTIWSAADLDRPDRAFDETARTTWIQSHPEWRREADTRYFQFEAGRLHRVRVVKDDRRTQLWIDGRMRAESDVRFQPGPLQDRIVLTTYGPLDVDDLRIAGTLDPEWLKRR